MEAIRCTDRLPEANEEVLVYETEAGWRLAWLVIGKQDKWWENCHDVYGLHQISHWMTLPPEPVLTQTK